MQVKLPTKIQDLWNKFQESSIFVKIIASIKLVGILGLSILGAAIVGYLGYYALAYCLPLFIVIATCGAGWIVGIIIYKKLLTEFLTVEDSIFLGGILG